MLGAVNKDDRTVSDVRGAGTNFGDFYQRIRQKPSSQIETGQASNYYYLELSATNSPLDRFLHKAQMLNMDIDTASDTELEHIYLEMIREIYQVVRTANPWRFNQTFISSMLEDLSSVIGGLNSLAGSNDHAFFSLVNDLKSARAELRVTHALFDVEEISPIHRLMIRNKTTLKFRELLQSALQDWSIRSVPAQAEADNLQ